MFADFECVRCGHCCTTLTVSDVDFVLPCPHLKEDKSCAIYENRPDMCKNYPHTLEFAIKTGCKGFHKGKLCQVMVSG